MDLSWLGKVLVESELLRIWVQVAWVGVGRSVG